jgi:ketosteroid isomerase-like protein
MMPASRVALEHRYCQVWTFDHGRIVRGAAYHALAATIA